MLRLHQLAQFLVILLLILAKPSHAEQQKPTSCLEGAECVEIRLVPATLTGDIYLDERLIVKGQNNAIVPIVRGQKHLVQVLNIQDPSTDFGDLYIWKDVRHILHYEAGQPLQEITINPQKTFVAGILDFNCRIQDIADDEEVYCTVTIDGVLQSNQVKPGASTTYFLTPGIHKVFVGSGGEQAGRWRCCGKQHIWRVIYEIDGPKLSYTGHKILIWAGRTRTLTPIFIKASNLVVKLNEPNMVGDIWIDGELVANQVNAADLWLVPTGHKVKVQNITSSSDKDVVLVVKRNVVSILLKSGETRVINIPVARLEPQYASWLAQVGQTFITLSFFFAIPLMFSKRHIFEHILHIFNARHTKTDENDLLERRRTNMFFALFWLTGHIVTLSAIFALLINLITTRLTYWSIPDWALIVVFFAILGIIEFPCFYRGRKTLTEHFIQLLIRETGLRNLMGFIALGLFIMGTLLYFKATGQV